MRASRFLLASLGSFGLLACLAAAPARAADNFSYFNPLITPAPPVFGFRALGLMLGDVENNFLTCDCIGSYNLNLRGVGAAINVDFALVGNATLTQILVSVPSRGLTATILEATPDAAFERLRQLLTQGEIAKAIQQEQARNSPFDPVAGNPGSLMARAVAFDFFTAFYPFASNFMDDDAMLAQAGGPLPASAVRGPMRSLPGVGLFYSNFHDQGLRSQSYTLPLTWTFRSDLDPRRQFTVSLPLTVQDVDGARAYQGMFSSALRLPLNRDWAVTTAVGYSQVRSTDLGTAGHVASAAVTSAYVFRTGVGDISLGNMLGYYRTLGGKVGGQSAAGGIGDAVFRNGLLWSGKIASGVSLETFVINTHYAGTPLYVRNYTELGVQVGSNKRADSVRSYWQSGVSYLLSSKTKGLGLNAAYWF